MKEDKNMQGEKPESEGLNLPDTLEERTVEILDFIKWKTEKTHGKKEYSSDEEPNWRFRNRPISGHNFDRYAFDILKLLRQLYGLKEDRVNRGHLANYIRGHEYMVPFELSYEIVALETVGKQQWLKKLIPYKTYEEIMRRAEMVVDLNYAIFVEERGGKEPAHYNKERILQDRYTQLKERKIKLPEKL